jgi:hypothetical protein
MTEQSKAILLNAQDIVFETKPRRTNPLSEAILQGKIDYKKTPTDFLLEQKIALYYGQLAELKPEALSFIMDKSTQADIYIGNVDYRDVDNVNRIIKEAGLSSKNLKSMFLKKDGWEEVVDKGTAINKLRKRYHSRVDYYDSSEGDVLDLARIFRPVQFYLVQNGFSGRIFSKQDPPNVHRIAKLPEKAEIL